MKHTIAAGVLIALLVALAGCGGDSAVTTDEAKEAFAVSYASVLVVSLGTAFGEEIDGVSLNEETGELTLDGFDLGEYVDVGEEELTYETISGSVVSGASSVAANLTLEGGPVTAIEFELGPEEFQATEGFTTTLVVNGEEIELEITGEDLGG
ncbi:MAG: hypothetical protein ACOC2Y_03770 [Spirochaetota bacterium]